MSVPKTIQEVEAHNSRVAAGKLSKLSGAAGGSSAAVAKQPLTALATAVAPGIRIRQDSKPIMNPLEQSWFDYLKLTTNFNNLTAQSIRFKLANGAWYKPDIAGWHFERLTVWECKGGRKMKGIAKAHLTLKIAAQQWPDVTFILVWKESGEWRTQKILP